MKRSIHAITLSAAVSIAASHTIAANYVWVGSDADWSTTANWQDELGGAGAVPGTADAAAFTDLAPGADAYSVNAGVAGQSLGQLRFGTNTPTLTSPALTRAVTLNGGTLTLAGVAGGGGNFIGIARPEGSTGAVTINNNIVLAGAASEQRFNIEAGDPIILKGSIGETGGSIGLRKVGAGTLVLDGDTSYTGLTTAQTGVLFINGNATGNGTYSVQANGTLAGNGAITGTITVSGANSAISPGTTGVGTLTVTGPVTFNNGTLRIDLDGTGTGSTDQFAVSGTLSLSNQVKLALSALSPIDDEAYVIATYGSLTGTFNPLNITGLPDGYKVEYNYGGANQIAVVPVPEPGLLAFASAAALLPLRRRRR